jgi:hypothetical protein
LAIFASFGRHVTNLRGIFVENVKRSKINPPYQFAGDGELVALFSPKL